MTAIIFVLLIVVITDLLSRKISNISVLCLLVFVLAHRFTLPEPQWINAVALSLAVLVVGLLFWQKQWLGGGDVKLLSVCALFVFPDWSLFLLVTALASGGLAIALLVKAYFYPAAETPSLPLGVAIVFSCGYVLF